MVRAEGIREIRITLLVFVAVLFGGSGLGRMGSGERGMGDRGRGLGNGDSCGFYYSTAL